MAGARHHPGERPIVAGVVAPRHGWIAALGDGRVVASLHGRAVTTGVQLYRLLRAAEGAPHPLGSRQLSAALRAVHRMLGRERLAAECGITGEGARMLPSVERTIASLSRQIPRHERAAAAQMVRELRAMLARGLPLGLERDLSALARGAHHASPTDALPLLRAALDLGRRASAHPAASAAERGPQTLLAVIVLAPARG
jgi:hypothetical protein